MTIIDTTAAPSSAGTRTFPGSRITLKELGRGAVEVQVQTSARGTRQVIALGAADVTTLLHLLAGVEHEPAAETGQLTAIATTTRTEWGVAYLAPLVENGRVVDRVRVEKPMLGESFARAAVNTRTPVHGTDHQVVARQVSEWVKA